MVGVWQNKETLAGQITAVTQSCSSLWSHQVLSCTHKTIRDVLAGKGTRNRNINSRCRAADTCLKPRYRCNYSSMNPKWQCGPIHQASWHKTAVSGSKTIGPGTRLTHLVERAPPMYKGWVLVAVVRGSIPTCGPLLHVTSCLSLISCLSYLTLTITKGKKII